MTTSREEVMELVSLHDVARDSKTDIRSLRRWCHLGLRVHRSQIQALRKAGWKIVDGRCLLWSRKVGNDRRTTWDKLNEFLRITEPQR